MKAEVRLVFITYNPGDSSMRVLVDKGNLPGKSISSDSPEEAIAKASKRYVDIEPEYLMFDLSDYLYSKDTKTLTLIFYTFIPSPVPTKKGNWELAWEIFREPENEKLFQSIQACVTKAFRSIQTKPLNI
jgi:hypothetical protein